MPQRAARGGWLTGRYPTVPILPTLPKPVKGAAEDQTLFRVDDDGNRSSPCPHAWIGQNT
ncbi:hypothetical protein LX32DRAFT_637521 [Colletotrichum zoysiae]|uniref:Uncharacterized protein n=1 Tax=Colletotrichum zoysiae TaxID=1216348 RepID=A0AAD9HNC4_9PEZI|nr:hypothetical protein LX32DRAFT_637521 [Colletotrichum zoysiae]